MLCPSCSSTVKDEAQVCPTCGADLASTHVGRPRPKEERTIQQPANPYGDPEPTASPEPSEAPPPSSPSNPFGAAEPTAAQPASSTAANPFEGEDSTAQDGPAELRLATEKRPALGDEVAEETASAGRAIPPPSRPRTAIPSRRSSPTRDDPTSEEDPALTTAGRPRRRPVSVPQSRLDPSDVAADRPRPKGGYATVGSTAPDSTKAGDGVLRSAPPAPPVDPEAVFRNLIVGIAELPVADKVEALSAALMMLMVFMPWRAYRGDDEIGLVTWGGFWSLVITAGFAFLLYARHARRLPTIPEFVLLAAEAGLAALTIALPIAYGATHIIKHVTKSSFGEYVSYISVPEFGLVLAILCGVGMEVGAVMVILHHQKAAGEADPSRHD